MSVVFMVPQLLDAATSSAPRRLSILLPWTRHPANGYTHSATCPSGHASGRGIDHAPLAIVGSVTVCCFTRRRRVWNDLRKPVAAHASKSPSLPPKGKSGLLVEMPADPTRLPARSAKRKIRAEINDVRLVSKARFLSHCPPENAAVPEIAVFGRSNVGKSSLINFLCKRKDLVSTSKTPGHTKLVHHYLIDRSWYMVDLPGIGHADATGKQLKNMDRIVSAYVRHRTNMVQMLYLVDASLPPQQIDLDGIKWLTEAGCFLTVVFTKSDKESTFMKKNRWETVGAIDTLKDALWKMDQSPWRLGIHSMPEMLLTSAHADLGRHQLLGHIADILHRAKPRHTEQGDSLVDVRASRMAAKTDGPPQIR